MATKSKKKPQPVAKPNEKELNVYRSLFALENHLEEFQRSTTAQMKLLVNQANALHEQLNQLRISRGRPLPSPEQAQILGGTGTK